MAGVVDYLKLKVVLPIFTSLSIFLSPHNSSSYYQPSSKFSIDEIEKDIHDFDSIINLLEHKVTNMRKLKIKDIMPKSSMYLDSLFAYSKEFDVEPEEIAAIIYNESKWNPNAVSNKGCMGLGQQNPRFKKGNLFDPYHNMKETASDISNYMKMYSDKRIAYAAYNAGIGAVKKYGGIPPYEETKNFVNRVCSTRDKLKIYL